MRLMLTLSCVAILSACSLSQDSSTSSVSKSLLTKIEQNPLEQHEAEELNGRVIDSFVYGEGLGDSAVKVGAAVAFPPFIFVLLGNAALTASGYEPIGISTVLPEDASKQWQAMYSGVVSVPGKITATAANRDFVAQTPMVVASEYLNEREYLAEVF
jgi:hypothetical protein